MLQLHIHLSVLCAFRVWRKKKRCLHWHKWCCSNNTSAIALHVFFPHLSGTEIIAQLKKKMEITHFRKECGSVATRTRIIKLDMPISHFSIWTSQQLSIRSSQMKKLFWTPMNEVLIYVEFEFSSDNENIDALCVFRNQIAFHW